MRRARWLAILPLAGALVAALAACPAKQPVMSEADGLFIVVGMSGTILTSTDGVAWTQEESGTNRNLLGIAVGNGRVVAVGMYGVILVGIATSSDAVTWTVAERVTDEHLTAVTFRRNGW